MVDQPAISVRLIVRISHGLDTEVREAVTKFLEVLFAENFTFVAIWPPSHCKQC
jgi:hypothetical protein